jgi:hypothetical protein
MLTWGEASKDEILIILGGLHERHAEQREIWFAVYSENCTKPINKCCGYNVDLSTLKVCGTYTGL